MKKNKLKLALDLVMLIVLVLLFRKSAISMTFHEIGGLALLGVFVFHLILNYKWIAGVTKKLFSKALPARTRVGYAVNVLLLVSFVLIGVSGIFISKTLFHLNVGGMAWKTIHYSASAAALVLMGVHLGLHAGFIKSVVLKRKRHGKPAAVIGVILAVVIALYGCYSMATTSFVGWITMPFSSNQMQGEHSSGPDGTQLQGNGASGDHLQQGNGGMQAQKEGGSPGISALTIIQTIASFLSIAFDFAVITFFVDALFRRIKKNRPEQTALAE